MRFIILIYRDALREFRPGIPQNGAYTPKVPLVEMTEVSSQAHSGKEKEDENA